MRLSGNQKDVLRTIAFGSRFAGVREYSEFRGNVKLRWTRGKKALFRKGLVEGDFTYPRLTALGRQVANA